MRYVFGDCSLDTQRYVLHRAGQPIRLRPKVFQVLLYLITQRERVVPKQELSAQVWDGRFISDATLESTLAAVRRALGDRGREHRYIHTFHGHGYRFVAPVAERADPLPDAASAPRLPIGEAPRAAPRDRPPTAAVAAPPEVTGEMDVGERKLVTVLCCALSPTPGLRDPADLDILHQQVQALYDLAQHEAQRYGGAVQPVVGERVLVVFGLPAAQEDHAQRAVLAALGLQQRLPQGLTAGGRTPTAGVPVCIAVHTGPVAVSGLSGAAATATAVVGETVTQAVDLQAIAPPGVLLCSEATARLVRGVVRVKAMASAAGPYRPTPVYQVVGLYPGRVPIGWYAGRRLSPFVGRDHELATLQTLLRQAEAGRGQVVGIVGEPGMGKSRLLYEFRHRLRRQRLTYLAAGCLSYAQATPYWPIRELLRHHCSITADDAPATIRAKVHRGLEQVGMAADEAAPYLLHLLEVPDAPALTAAQGPQAIRSRTIGILVQLALAGARRRPLVLEVENLHWCDPSSEEVLTALVERLAGAPLLLLVSYRPGYRLP